MPTSKDSSNPQSYELEVLTIVNNEGDGFDIRSIFQECNIYESITRNFLLGEVIVSDAVAFLENAKLFGQESIRIRFKQPAGYQSDELDEDDLIDQVFRIYKIDKIMRLNASAQAFKINFCSPEMLESKRKRISQAFRGSMTDIAAKIGEEHLEINNEDGWLKPKLESYFEVREKSQGDKYHVVIPNWTVGYTINWLCKQAQGVDSNSGLQDSFYWYQTANGGYRIQSLDSMMKTEYGGGAPFTLKYGASQDGYDLPYDKADGEGSIGMGRRILAYSVNTQADVLKGVVNGLFSSKQTTVDNTYKYYTEKTYSFLETHYGGEGQSMSPHPFVRTQPENLHIGTNADKGDVEITGVREGNGIGDYPDAHQILTSDSSFVNDDKDQIHQANHMTHLGSQQFRAAANQLLEYYTINVVLSARTDISVGQLINLNIPSVRPGEGDTDPIFHNGMHLITEIMWNLTPSKCKVNVKCVRDSVLTNIETTAIVYGETETT